MRLITKKQAITLLILVFVSPVFGVVLADLVGYHEPLDLAAEKLGLSEITEQINWTPFLDYTIPGLPPEIGYIISGLIGLAIILTICYAILKVCEKRTKK